MKLVIEPGLYVVAVSGGVDSMVLLDLLARRAEQVTKPTERVKLVVAHYDHGIRPDSTHDRQLVQRAAERHGLPFVFDQGYLGAGASEATARTARYAFLHIVRLACRARAIITAHHQDDVLETAVINLLRGTGRRGLTSLQSKDPVIRPLLHVPKREILDYAAGRNLTWHEDSTNQDERYLRNYVRRRILAVFSASDRQRLLAIVEQTKELNDQLDTLLTVQLHIQPATHKLDRHWFIGLPHAVAKEAMAAWLRARGVQQFDAKTIERLVASAKTYQPHKHADINVRYTLQITQSYLALLQRDR